MKKMISILLLGMMMAFCSKELYAYDLEPLTKVNYLDLSNLEYHNTKIRFADTKESIVLKPESTFTLVLSKAFLGDHWGNLDDYELMIAEASRKAYYTDLLIFDEVNECAYIYFDTNEGIIDFEGIPVDSQLNYEAILYEGLYEDFPGYIPYIEENEKLEYFGYLPMDYDQQLDTNIITSYVVAKNPTGSVIPSSIVFDDYTASSKKPGNYQMIFQTDFNNIPKRYYLQLTVFDLSGPVLSIEGTLSIPLKDKWSMSKIKEYITITDNVDLISKDSLIVIEDTYSDAQTTGLYQLKFQATDLSGNSGTLEVSIELVDNQGPEIKGPSDIYTYVTDEPISNTDLLNKLIVFDDVDLEDVQVSIVSNEYQQTKVPGMYIIEFKATDQTMNESLFSMNIHVIDNRGPIFEQSDFILNKTTSDQMTESEIIDWLKNQLSLNGHHATAFKVLYNEYDEHENVKGSYYVYLAYQIGDEELTSRVQVKVEEERATILWAILPIGLIALAGISIFFYSKHKKH